MEWPAESTLIAASVQLVTLTGPVDRDLFSGGGGRISAGIDEDRVIIGKSLPRVAPGAEDFAFDVVLKTLSGFVSQEDADDMIEQAVRGVLSQQLDFEQYGSKSSMTALHKKALPSTFCFCMFVFLFSLFSCFGLRPGLLIESVREYIFLFDSHI